MDDNGRCEEGGGEAKVAPSTVDVGLSESTLSKISWLEAVYTKPEGHPWRDEDQLYRLFYRDEFTETEKDEFLKVPVSELDYFCKTFCGKHDPSWLRNMLADVGMFFKLHDKWQVYICPSPECLCWFLDDDSLVLHLMREHCNAWPFLRRNCMEEMWCAQVLHRTVWEPIDVKVALNILFTTCSSLDAHHLDYLEWPLSEDHRRSNLLAQLRKGFEVILNTLVDKSFRVHFSGCLRALLAVASEDTLRHLDPMNILPPPFRVLLDCSPLSFRFMEEDSLVPFVNLVEGICNLIRASENRELGGSKDFVVNSSKRGVCDAVSFSADCDYFVLDAVKLNEKDMGLWMHEAPFFPMIEKLPTEASEIFELAERKAASFSECLGSVCAQSDCKLLASCLNIWNMGHWPRPLLGPLCPVLASNSESNTANVKDMSAPCCSFGEPAKRQKTDFDSQHYLELIKLTWELQFFELQVRRLCAVDLREYILPLLKSFLRMKLYMFFNLGDISEPGDVIEEDTGEHGKTVEWSQEKHPVEHVHSKIEREPAAEDGCDVMMPDMSSYKRCEELSAAPLELVCSGSSAICVSDLDPMMIEGGAALKGAPPGASAGCTDSSTSQVASADAALPKSRTNIVSGIKEPEAKPEAIPESDAEPESKAEPELDWSLETHGPLCCDFDMYSDSDSLSESEDRVSELKEFSNVVWLMRGHCAWENKQNGLFVRMMVNDVMKHCLEKFGLQTAQKIWEWKISRTQKYWHCYNCGMRFPDQKSHMLHMESQCYFETPWECDWLVPSQVCQEGQSGVDVGVKERTHGLDDSITVDDTYRTVIVEMEKFGSSYQNEEKCEVQNGNQVDPVVWRIPQLVHSLFYMLGTKWTYSSRSEIVEVDSEIEKNLAELKTSKQNLSNMCVSDYRNEILPSIHSLLQKHVDNGFSSWALQKFNELLCSVRCPCLPDSFSIKLASSGKVIINMEDYGAGITFAYVGLRWEFAGDLSFKGSRKIKGIFMFAGSSNKNDDIQYERKVIIDKEVKRTNKMFYFRLRLAMHLTVDLLEKLPKFQAELRARLQG